MIVRFSPSSSSPAHDLIDVILGLSEDADLSKSDRRRDRHNNHHNSNNDINTNINMIIIVAITKDHNNVDVPCCAM
jgi:hypothetical protein